MQELFLALDSVNERSAPGKDGITWRMLRNLDEPEKKKLLAELNQVWETGAIPGEWKPFCCSLQSKTGQKGGQDTEPPPNTSYVDTM